MKGSYIIVIFLPTHRKIRIGALGKILFRLGYYFYTGSAMGKGSSSLEKRIARHISLPENKKIHWHIDYLLKDQECLIERIYLIPSQHRLECVLAREIHEVSDNSIENFGSSDCLCKSHLLYFKKFRSFL